MVYGHSEKFRNSEIQKIVPLSFCGTVVVVVDEMAMTGEYPPYRADTTNNIFLSAMDDVHTTPSLVNGNDARCTTTIPNVDDSIST